MCFTLAMKEIKTGTGERNENKKYFVLEMLISYQTSQWSLEETLLAVILTSSLSSVCVKEPSKDKSCDLNQSLSSTVLASLRWIDSTCNLWVQLAKHFLINSPVRCGSWSAWSSFSLSVWLTLRNIFFTVVDSIDYIAASVPVFCLLAGCIIISLWLPSYSAVFTSPVGFKRSLGSQQG